MLTLLLRPLGTGTQPTASVSAGPFTEAQIVAGGQDIVITLTNDTWVGAGAPFNGIRQDIINGLNSAQSEALGWNNVVRALQGVAGVVRTSNTEVTITLDAQATYDITANETITVTVPASAVTSSSAIVASPPFDVIAAPAVVAPSADAGRGRKRIFRVRRSDFSSQETYELALKAALAEANLAILSDREPEPEENQEPPKPRKKRIVVTDTAMKVSVSDLLAIQQATEMEEIQVLEMLVNLIEDEWE
jgi:hypothetical protein